MAVTKEKKEQRVLTEQGAQRHLGTKYVEKSNHQKTASKVKVLKIIKLEPGSGKARNTIFNYRFW